MKKRSQNNKYEINEDGRVVALKSFADVNKGDVGGFVDSYGNLSQDGNCWVYDDAKVYGDARVSGNATVSDNAQISGNAQIFNSVSVYGNAEIFGNADVFDNVKIFGNAKIYGYAEVSGSAKIYDYVYIFENAQVYGNAKISGEAQIFGTAEIYDNVEISGEASVDYDVSGDQKIIANKKEFNMERGNFKKKAVMYSWDEWAEHDVEEIVAWYMVSMDGEEFDISADLLNGIGKEYPNVISDKEMLEEFWEEISGKKFEDDFNKDSFNEHGDYDGQMFFRMNSEIRFIDKGFIDLEFGLFLDEEWDCSMGEESVLSEVFYENVKEIDFDSDDIKQYVK